MPQLTLTDWVVLTLVAVNLILLFTGIAKLAIYTALDSVIYLFFPRVSLKYDLRKYYPSFTKDAEGNILKRFRTTREMYYPAEPAPFAERLVDCVVRFPLYSIIIYFAAIPIFSPYINRFIEVLQTKYELISGDIWSPFTNLLLRIVILLFFSTLSSIHITQISSYVVLMPFMLVWRAIVFLAMKLWNLILDVWYNRIDLKFVIPGAIFLGCGLVLLFSEIVMNYIGFCPIFHKGIMPFIDKAEGLQHIIMWSPFKLEMYLDLVLTPIVLFIPLTTSFGGYILAKTEASKRKENINYVVLFYKTAIAYSYGALLGMLFPKLGNEVRAIRNERKINEIIVLCMFIESLVCTAGVAYSYHTIAVTNHMPASALAVGLVTFLVFVPMITFSLNGIQAMFMDFAWNAYKRFRRIPV